MNVPRFDQFFKEATGNPPYDYQRRLACGERKKDRPEAEWLTNGATCRSQLINIPTGLGKTAAVVLAWLWNRAHLHNPNWPRRLVYCLPMRTLVEQTEREVRKWVQAHGLLWNGVENRLGTIGVHVLMGGEEAGEWDIYPEGIAILIGTQDMLLSRALNRGYGMSRYRWPMHFSLLNNDCLWVFDEVQLMGSGLPTTTQLQAFRACFPPAVTSHSWWMSATSEREWLKTVDFDPAILGLTVELTQADRDNSLVRDRLEAHKPVTKTKAPTTEAKSLAKEIITAAEQSAGLTLVVMNTVKQARTLWSELRKLVDQSQSKTMPLLLHSRFRPGERARRLAEILASEGQHGIVVSTQVIEAGVDLSAATLVTELALWSSLVQRFGRCNRRGTDSQARVLWVETSDPAPYTLGQLDAARKCLENLCLNGNDAAPTRLAKVPLPAADQPLIRHIIRRKDFVELFDTTPDLAGNDIDIDRWVREVDDSSVQVFWRDWDGAMKGSSPEPEFPAADRLELCPTPVGQFRDFVKKEKTPVWRWDFLEGEWQRAGANEIFPGQIYLLRSDAGGYSEETGWDPSVKAPVQVVTATSRQAEPDQTDEDHASCGVWQSVAQHTSQVCAELDAMLEELPVNEASLLRLAARWHDFGKAHSAFQAKLRPQTRDQQAAQLGGEPIAKAPGDAWLKGRLRDDPLRADRRRKHFRHELASALAVLIPETTVSVSGQERDLVAYLVASHHGKVRLSIRSLPGEYQLADDRRFARGVWDNDSLPETNLGDDIVAPMTILSLEPMELGLGQRKQFFNLPSWAERMLTLRDKFGPFRLAFLETVLRAADERASALANNALIGQITRRDAATTDSGVEKAPAGSAPAPDVGERAGGRVSQYANGGRTGELVLAEGDTRPYGATRYLDTIFGPLPYTEVAERLALRAAEVRRSIIAGDYGSQPLSDELIATLHRDLCSQWRVTEVTVGSHHPPLHFQVPLQMRNLVESPRNYD